MKEHYGKGFVPRIAKTKRQARHSEERKEICQLIRTGRRMARRTARQETKEILRRMPV